MFQSSRKLSVLVLVGLFSLTLVSSAFAAEGNSFTDFFKKLFHVPVKTTQEVAGVTANALENTG